MWTNKSQYTLPSAFPFVRPSVHRYALFGGNSAPLTKQGTPHCESCNQLNSNFEFYAKIAK